MVQTFARQTGAISSPLESHRRRCAQRTSSDDAVCERRTRLLLLHGVVCVVRSAVPYIQVASTFYVILIA